MSHNVRRLHVAQLMCAVQYSKYTPRSAQQWHSLGTCASTAAAALSSWCATAMLGGAHPEQCPCRGATAWRTHSKCASHAHRTVNTAQRAGHALTLNVLVLLRHAALPVHVHTPAATHLQLFPHSRMATQCMLPGYASTAPPVDIGLAAGEVDEN
jgi:hypothetical protein